MINPYTVLDTGESLKALCNHLEKESRVFYTRFGDGEIYLMCEPWACIGQDKDKWTNKLMKELIEAINIKHPFFMKAISVGHPIEKGMDGICFAPFPYTPDLIRRVKMNLRTGETTFYNHPLFHYLAVFRPLILKEFIQKYIWRKPKMFIGSCLKSNMEKFFGPIDVYIETPEHNAFSEMAEWWPRILAFIEDVRVVLPACGCASKIVQKRLWNLGYQIHSIDFGSVVDAIDNKNTRSWIRLKGKETREALLNE